MSAPTLDPGPPSLLRITVRRSVMSGRFYLIYGVVIATILSVSLGLSGGAAFVSAYPLLLPVFAVVGSLGALTVFSTDRMKGVLEYLMAYGISPRRLFTNILLATLVLVTPVLAVGLGVGVGIYLAKGNTLTLSLTESLGAYAIPMSYASAAFCATIGMFWTSLSSPSQGLNSPIGLAPLIGIGPPMVTVGIIGVLSGAGIAGGTTLDLVAIAAMVLVAVIVIVLVSLTGRLLARERLLSPT